jgi:hypothetical protein
VLLVPAEKIPKATVLELEPPSKVNPLTVVLEVTLVFTPAASVMNQATAEMVSLPRKRDQSTE